MIGLLKGQILSKNPENNHVVLLCAQVGYEVVLPKTFYDRLELSGEQGELTLWIHTHVREDVLVLYGFPSEMEKNFFRILLSMSGLGPKTALSLIGEHGAPNLAQFILAKDVSSISEAPGVGKKLASKMVLELSSKVEKLAWLDKLQSPTLKTSAPKAESAEDQLRSDLTSALVHLGFQPNHIKMTLEKIWERENTQKASFEGLLKSALNEMTARPRNMTMELNG